jgi:hypothetical protein
VSFFIKEERDEVFGEVKSVYRRKFLGKELWFTLVPKERLLEYARVLVEHVEELSLYAYANFYLKQRGIVPPYDQWFSKRKRVFYGMQKGAMASIGSAKIGASFQRGFQAGSETPEIERAVAENMRMLAADLKEAYLQVEKIAGKDYASLLVVFLVSNYLPEPEVDRKLIAAFAENLERDLKICEQHGKTKEEVIVTYAINMCRAAFEGLPKEAGE